MIIAWLPQQNASLYTWDGEDKTWTQYESWQKVADSHQSKQVALYFPSQNLQKISSSLPESRLKQLGEKGLQYLFEDNSLTAVEQLKVKQVKQGEGSVLYALAQQDISHWQNSIELSGLELTMLIPDFLLLPKPTHDDEVTVYQGQNTGLVRSAEYDGLASSYLPIVFNKLNTDDSVFNKTVNKVTQITLCQNIEQSSDNQALLTQIKQSIRQPDDEQNDIIFNKITTSLEPIELNSRFALNFFVKKSSGNISPYFKIAAAVFVSALIVQLLVDTLSQYGHSKATEMTQNVIQTQFESWFPNDSLNNRTQLQLQMADKLVNSGNTESEALNLLAKVSPMLQQSNLNAQYLNLSDNAINMTLHADNRQSLDSFVNNLQGQGINVELGAVSNLAQDSNEISGEVTIK